MRVESSSQGKLVEALAATAFEAHPYRNMPGGWASDIEHFRRPDAGAVLQTILRARKYDAGHRRGRQSGGSGAATRREIFLDACRRVPCPRSTARSSLCKRARSASRCRRPRSLFFMILRAYKRGDRHSGRMTPRWRCSDSALSDGRTGIIYKDMVRDKQMAARRRQPARSSQAENIPSLFRFLLLLRARHRPLRRGKRKGELYQLVEPSERPPRSMTKPCSASKPNCVRRADSQAMARQHSDSPSSYEATT